MAIEQKQERIMSSKQKIKKDGTILRSKEEICRAYDYSYLPYPLSALFELDYCARLQWKMFQHSMYLALPFTITAFFWQNPNAFQTKLRHWPFRRIIFLYSVSIVGINAFNTITSLMFEPYCDRYSIVYEEARTSKALRQLLEIENEKHKDSFESKTQRKLSDEDMKKLKAAMNDQIKGGGGPFQT